jgi:hypothetical protein
VGKKKWQVTVELSNGQVSYSSIDTSDLGGFVRKRKKRILEETGKRRGMVPVEPWVLDKVFEKCKDFLSAYSDASRPDIRNIKIVPDIKVG